MGYSFGRNKQTSSKGAGADIVSFLQRWLPLYPGMAAKKLYIAGESYAGHFVPVRALQRRSAPAGGSPGRGRAGRMP